MRPHPDFRGSDIPAAHVLGAVTLRALCVDDLDRDYEAVMQSAADIRAANPEQTWPEGLTRSLNLLDLSWHQVEFASGRSFAWVIEDGAGAYLGCLYVYPLIGGTGAADVRWWWRTGSECDRKAFREALVSWLSGPDWPRLEYRLQDA